MNRLLTLIAIGSGAVLLFDVIAATASRGMGWPYIRASVGSFLIYAILGAVAARFGGMSAAARAGLVVGLIDATLGEAISASIGPVRSPLLSNAPSYRVLLAIEVVGLAVILSCAGGFAAMRWLRRA